MVAMHYIGMRGVHVSGELHYRPVLVAASAVLAVGAATLALWFAVSVQGWAPITGAAALIGAGRLRHALHRDVGGVGRARRRSATSR